MATISLCMIVKNEEETLERCLNSVKDLVDEIIIVDTGSTDRTKKIAKSFTNYVYDFKWIDDFSAARNYAFSKATQDYQLWLDADDVLLEKDRIAFKNLKESLTLNYDMVLMKYNTHFDANGNPVTSFHRERLIKRVNNYQWNDPVHEYIACRGQCLMSDIAITHSKTRHEFSDRNLKIYEQRLEDGVPFSPRMLYYYARELRDHGKTQKAIDYFNKFLTSKKGAYFDNINACLDIGRLYQQSGKQDKALEKLFYSFNYGLPQAEIVCEIAKIYQAKKEFQKAIHWFEYALAIKPEKRSLGFKNHDTEVFTPAIELCVCYFQIGNIEQAIYYNNLAASVKPNHVSVLDNKKFFAQPASKELAQFFKGK